MSEMTVNSAYFGVVLSIGAFLVGRALQKRFKHPLCNPLLIAIVLVILFLLVFHVDYESYQSSAKLLSSLLTPATVCLAIPLYEQFELLKKNVKAVLAGIVSGVLSSLCCVLVLALLFRLDHASYVTFLPKSITTAIGMGVSEELGGYVSITVAVIIISGILGNIFAESACRLFRVTEPIARGVAIGSASHAIGTAKAMELGEIEGAMSSLSIVVSGLLTVIGAAVFANFL